MGWWPQPARGWTAFNLTIAHPGAPVAVARTSSVRPPSGGSTTALQIFRHFKAATGQLDPDALITGASSAGELFAATVTPGAVLRVAQGTFDVHKLVPPCSSGHDCPPPSVGGFSKWDFMGVSMYLGVTISSGPVVFNSVVVSRDPNLEPSDPSTWVVQGLPQSVKSPPGFPTESGCGATVEHNDVIYIACANANTVLGVSLESDANPVFNIPFPGKHARGLLLVGDALFVAGGNDVYVYDLSNVDPDTPAKTPPVQIGHCGGACAKILGSSAVHANAHGMAYQYDEDKQTHHLVLTAAYANRVGMVEITATAVTKILTRYACDPDTLKCVANQQGDFSDQYSCRLSRACDMNKKRE